jgi:hypothetical protein
MNQGGLIRQKQNPEFIRKAITQEPPCRWEIIHYEEDFQEGRDLIINLIFWILAMNFNLEEPGVIPAILI